MVQKPLQFFNASSIENEANELAKGIYNGTIKSGIIQPNMVAKVAEKLSEAVFEGFGSSFDNIDYNSPDVAMLDNLERNVYQFSAAKNFQELKELNSLLMDSKGKLRSFQDFRDDVLRVHGKYNLQWLRTEYNTAVNAATMAARWTEFEELADIMPLLRYDTVGDERVRASHAALDGITKPINHSFWNTYYPPNDWNCRCSVSQMVEGKESPEIDINIKVPGLFKTNLAKQGLAFPAKHPYYKGVPKKAIKQGESLRPDRGFIPANSIKEAEQWALDKGLAKEVKYNLKGMDKDFGLQIANEVNQALYLNKKLTMKAYDKVKFTTMRGSHKTNVPMANVLESRRVNGEYIYTSELRINKGYINKFKNLDDINTSIAKKFDSNWWQAEKYSDFVHHEFGHRLTIEKTFKLPNFALKGYADKSVSNYGGYTLDETLAEIFCHYRKTGKCKKEWKELFNKFSSFKI